MKFSYIDLHLWFYVHYIDIIILCFNYNNKRQLILKLLNHNKWLFVCFVCVFSSFSIYIIHVSNFHHQLSWDFPTFLVFFFFYLIYVLKLIGLQFTYFISYLQCRTDVNGDWFAETVIICSNISHMPFWKVPFVCASWMHSSD